MRGGRKGGGVWKAGMERHMDRHMETNKQTGEIRRYRPGRKWMHKKGGLGWEGGKGRNVERRVR